MHCVVNLLPLARAKAAEATSIGDMVGCQRVTQIARGAEPRRQFRPGRNAQHTVTGTLFLTGGQERSFQHDRRFTPTVVKIG